MLGIIPNTFSSTKFIERGRDRQEFLELSLSPFLGLAEAVRDRTKDAMVVELVKFEELENKIKNLIKEHALLKKRNSELEELLKSKGLELEGANNKIRGLNEERNSVRTKVDSLLDLLQDIKVR